MISNWFKWHPQSPDLNPTEGCGGMCDLHHGSAATMYCYRVKMDQNH